MPRPLSSRIAVPLALLGVLTGRASLAQTPPPTTTPAGGSDPAPGTVPAGTPASDASPRLLRFVEAEYPAEARVQGLEATVLLRLVLDEQGHVLDAEVIEPAGHGFDEAAVRAARQFEFAPARRGGEAVRAQLRYRYRFTLRTVEAPREPEAVLHGVVRDDRNRPVAGARVQVQPARGGAAVEARSDANGSFRFELENAGPVTVIVTRDGFRDLRSEERLAVRDDLGVVYRLSTVPVVAVGSGAQDARSATAASTRSEDRGEPTEPGITVRGQRPPREVTRTTLERHELMRIPGTGGDALRAIQNLPGLARAPFLSGALIVRGASPSDTNVFVDGTNLPLLYHFGGLSSVVQTEMLDRIDFYPGNFSARFGRAMGGTVDVGLRSPRRRGLRGVANLNAIDGSFFVEGAITPELSVAVAGRRSWVDAVLGAVLPNIPGINVTAAPVYYDYQGVLEWRPSARHRVRLAILGDDDALSVLFTRPNDAAPQFAGRVTFATRFHIAQLLWTHDIAPGTQGRAMLSAGWTNLDFGGTEQFSFSLSSVPINARYELSHLLMRGARLNIGLDAVAATARLQFSAIRLDPGGGRGQDTASAQRIGADVNIGAFRPALYTELELSPVPGVRLVPGVRMDYFHEIRQWSVQPRFSGRWEIVREWFLKGGVGLYSQPPSFQESSGAANAFIPSQTLGNPNLLPQRAMHYGLGMEHNFSRWISLSVEGFYKSIDALVVSTPTQLVANPTNPQQPYTNSGAGRIYGMEMLLRHKASDRFFGWIAYTLLRSEVRDSPTSEWRLFDQDQTHIFTAVGSVNLGAGWEIGARFRYVTGSPTTPVVGSFYSADSFTYTPINGARNSVRVRDFHQLDLRVDKTWRFRRGAFGVFLEVLNVYNNANQEGVVYNYDYTQSSILTGLPIFPNLGIRGEY